MIVVLEFPRSFFGQDDLGIHRITKGGTNGALSRDICIFVHYDVDGLVDPYVLHFIKCLRDADREIIFVSNAPSLDQAGVDTLSPLCREIIHRKNIGYDFGAWKAGLSRIEDIAELDTLILANDSVYGPLHDLRQTIADMQSKETDLCGITDTLDCAYHIQSYFVLYKNTVLGSSTFQDFWRHLPLFRRKWAVVSAAEIGLSKRLLKAGFKMGVLFKYEDLRTRYPQLFSAASDRVFGGYPNPTRAFWKQLVQSLGCPFLKVDIVRDQIASVDGIDDWRSVIEANSDYDPDLIQHHVNRVRKATSSAE